MEYDETTLKAAQRVLSDLVPALVARRDRSALTSTYDAIQAIDVAIRDLEATPPPEMSKGEVGMVRAGDRVSAVRAYRIRVSASFAEALKAYESACVTEGIYLAPSALPDMSEEKTSPNYQPTDSEVPF